MVPKGGSGKLCGSVKSSLLNSAASLLGSGSGSSCKGPKLKDDIEVKTPGGGFFVVALSFMKGEVG